MSEIGAAGRAFRGRTSATSRRGGPTWGRACRGDVRLLQYTLRDAIAAAHGPEAARRALVEAGRSAGREFCVGC